MLTLSAVGPNNGPSYFSQYYKGHFHILMSLYFSQETLLKIWAIILCTSEFSVLLCPCSSSVSGDLVLSVTITTVSYAVQYILLFV